MAGRIPEDSDAHGSHGDRDTPTCVKDPQTSGEGHLKSRVVKRSLVVGGHKTSVSLEDVFWNELRAIAHNRHIHLSQLVGSIDAERQHCNLSSAIRLYVFEHCRDHSDDAHRQGEALGHGPDSHAPRRP